MATRSENTPVKLKIDGQKYRGVITARDTTTDVVETTYGGLVPGGPPPDPYRTFAPGMRSTVLTIKVSGLVCIPENADVRMKIYGVKSYGRIVMAVSKVDEAIGESLTTLLVNVEGS